MIATVAIPYILLALKAICLYCAALYTLVNLARLQLGNSIPAINFKFQALGIVGFIVLQWLI